MLAEGNIHDWELDLFHVADTPEDVVRIIAEAHKGMADW